MNQSGFTVIEMVVVLGIVAVLSGLILPVATSARKRAQSVECLSNLRQIGVILHVYMNKYHGQLPHEDNGNTLPPKGCAWYKVLPEISEKVDIWTCPTERDEARSYKMNSLLEDEETPFAFKSRLRPRKLVAFFDGRVNNNGVKLAPKGTWAMADNRHPDGTHLLLLPGSVISYDSETGSEGWNGPGPIAWKPIKK